MAKLNLRSVNYNIQRIFPSYIVAAVVDCEYGYKGVKLINSPEELDKYYQGIKDREGLIQLLKGGASLYLTRLDREGTRSPSLRILNNDFRYCHPEVYDSIEETPLELEQELVPLVSPDKISLHKTYTYSYVLDFGLSKMEDEDFIAIPSFDEENEDFDNSVIFFFTKTNTSNMKFPNDFNTSVPLGTLGSKSFAINSDFPGNRDNRAELIYKWYLGLLEYEEGAIGLDQYNEFKLIEATLGGSQGDDNIIPELCELDKEKNKVTLVFKKPIRNIQYYNSNSNIKFKVYSDEFLNQELISRTSILDSVVSFESKLQGNLELDLTLKYITRYEFELEISSSEESEYHYVSLDRDVPLYQGRSIFIEDVISNDSDIVDCSVHLGGRIYSTLNNFSETNCASLEGNYKISYGKKGNNIPRYVYSSIDTDGDGYTDETEIQLGTDENDPLSIPSGIDTEESLEYPFQRSLQELVDSDNLPNIFLFNEFSKKEFQLECLEKYLNPNTIIGIVNIPEFITEEEDLDEFILEDSFREFILYTYGRFTLNDTTVSNSYLYSLNSITGNFKNSIIEGSTPENIDESVYALLDAKNINYLDGNKDYHFINKITNVDGFLDPHYILVANYVKIYMTRYLTSKLGLYPGELIRLANTEISKVLDYSNLIHSANISRFSSEGNNLDLTIDLELKGLVGRTLDVIIKINK